MSLDEISPAKQEYDTKHDGKDDTLLVGRKISKSSRRRTVDKTMKKIIAPFCKVVRRGGRGLSGEDHALHREVSEFQIFLSSNIDFTALLFDTANILKMSTQSTGVLVYLVDNMKNEIYLKPHHMNNVERHKVNWPIEEGKTMAAHAAATKEFVIIEDAAKETRFSEGMTWGDAKTALCLPVVQPDNTCYAVLELYRITTEPYFDEQLRAAQCCAGWIGAAVHQANKRVSIEQQLHLNRELLSLLMQYFSDQVSLDKMIYEMLTISKHCLKAMRSTLYIIDREFVGGDMMADIYDEGWDSTATPILKKNIKISLANTDTPHGLAATSGHSVNVKDVYSDGRFHKEVDPISGAIVRSVLCIPLRDKNGVIGVISVMNKLNEEIFTSEDKESFSIIANYCKQIIQYSYLQRKCKASKNLNRVYGELLERHMKPCVLDLDLMLENIISPVLPTNFDEFEWYVQSDCKDQIPEFVFYMIKRLPGGDQLDSYVLSEFILSVLEAYRDNPYHNAEHAFTFTHTLYNILMRNVEKFTKIEVLGLILGGFCHDIDHPGFNNSYLVESKHPLSAMYMDSILENHHYFITQKMLLDKGVLSDFTDDEVGVILDEIRYNILCTDLAIHFRIRAQLAPIAGDGSFEWSNPQHMKLIKSVMMTSCDLAVQAKPFTVVKKITEKLYEEFYNQGDLERDMGYTPLSMMDRSKSSNQATEQIQFLQIVVLPCLLLLQAVLAGTTQMTDFCLQAKESWLELNELRGKKLWHQMDSFARSANNVTIKAQSREFSEDPEVQ